MYSTDGINWIAESSSDDENFWSAITYGDGKFISVARVGSDPVMILEAPEGPRSGLYYDGELIATEVNLQPLFEKVNHLSQEIGGTGDLDSEGLRGYLDSNFVSRAGDSMTGALQLHGDPALPFEAATKNYVDQKIKSETVDSSNVIDIINGVIDSDDLIHVAADTMTGHLTLNADPTAPLHAATKQYVDSAVNNLTFDSNTIDDLITEVIDSDDLVHVAGDTMTGFLTRHDHPTDDFHAATKAYVRQVLVDAVDSAGGGISVDSGMLMDTFVLSAGDSVTGQLIAPSFKTGPDAGNDGQSILYMEPEGGSVHELEARDIKRHYGCVDRIFTSERYATF